mgnify:CR=1 FL=1
MKFTKMQGCGNDYIYVNCFTETVADPSAAAIRLSDRHFGIGGDGLVLICPSDAADFCMEMYNADGSRSEMCGNAIRCVGKYVYDRGLTDKTELTIETRAGIKTLWLNVVGGTVETVRVCMGSPEFRPEKIPVAAESSFPATTSPIAAAATANSIRQKICTAWSRSFLSFRPIR